LVKTIASPCLAMEKSSHGVQIPGVNLATLCHGQ
jgi:hypothetical protein